MRILARGLDLVSINKKKITYLVEFAVTADHIYINIYIDNSLFFTTLG